MPEYIFYIYRVLFLSDNIVFFLPLIDTAFMDEIWTFSMKMVHFGLTIFVGCYIFVTSLNYSAERQVELGGDVVLL